MLLAIPVCLKECILVCLYTLNQWILENVCVIHHNWNCVLCSNSLLCFYVITTWYQSWKWSLRAVCEKREKTNQIFFSTNQKETSKQLFTDKITNTKMASTSNSLPPPPIFIGENYHVWATKMRTYLRAQSSWEIVVSRSNPPPLPTTQQ